MHGRVRVRTDAAIYPLGNFKTDAIVHLSHGRPNNHRPCPRPSSSVCLTTLGDRTAGL
jgi:hypothetical protein